MNVRPPPPTPRSPSPNIQFALLEDSNMSGAPVGEQEHFELIENLEEDDSFGIVSFGEESESESDTDSFIEVTTEELDDPKNRGNENKSSFFDLGSRLLRYFNPMKENHVEEEFAACSIEEINFLGETILVNILEPDIKEPSLLEAEKNEHDGIVQAEKDKRISSKEEKHLPKKNMQINDREILIGMYDQQYDEIQPYNWNIAIKLGTKEDVNSEDSEAEYNFPELDRVDDYFLGRPHLLKQRKFHRSNGIRLL